MVDNTILKGVEFDPGFGPYLYAFQGSLAYLYQDINRFKNLSQKKMKFKQYYKKIISLFENNLGFYVGCLMWAAYIKKFSGQEILSNHCLGQEYKEEDNKIDTQYMMNFTQLFPKDMKYFLNEEFTFDEKYKTLISTYEEFLVLNKGFVDTKTTDDLILPSNVKTENTDSYKTVIDNAINQQNLSVMVQNINEII